MTHKVRLERLAPSMPGGRDAYVWAVCGCGWESDQWIGTEWAAEMQALGCGLKHREEVV